jgi:hypothetical protein
MRRKKPEILSETFEQRLLPDGRRKIKLRKDERAALLRRHKAEAAVTLFLDLNTDRTWAEIAQELDISGHALRDLTKTREFDEAYSLFFAEIGHDPRFRAAQGAISDMMPLAVRRLKELLTSDRTPPGVRLKTIEKVLTLNGLNNQPPAQSDRKELAEFLEERGVNIQVNQISVPAEYLQAMPEIVEGVFTEEEE